MYTKTSICFPLRNPDLDPDSFRHESVSARRIYEFKSYRDGQGRHQCHFGWRF